MSMAEVRPFECNLRDVPAAYALSNGTTPAKGADLPRRLESPRGRQSLPTVGETLFVTRRAEWYSEEPRRPPAEYACRLAGDRFWRDGRLSLIGTHPDFPDIADLIELGEEVAHALVLVLSRLPKRQRRAFADAFYAGRPRSRSSPWNGHGAPGDLRALAARVALLVVELADRPELASERIVDLLVGAAQGDDLTRTPEPAVAEFRRTIAGIRFDVDADDPADPRAAAATAILEVLDPSSEVVALQEVVARAALAAFESWGPPRVLAFLLDVDRAVADSGG